jgi:hypothetical protein
MPSEHKRSLLDCSKSAGEGESGSGDTWWAGIPLISLLILLTNGDVSSRDRRCSFGDTDGDTSGDERCGLLCVLYEPPALYTLPGTVSSCVDRRLETNAGVIVGAASGSGLIECGAPLLPSSIAARSDVAFETPL